MIGDFDLFDLILGPAGFLLILGLGIILRTLFKNDSNILYFLATMALFASFGEYKDAYGTESPDLVFPLQSLRQYGRIVTVAILGLISFYIFKKTIVQKSHKVDDVFAIKNGLLFIQILVFFKNLVYGDIITACLTFAIFSLVYLIFHRGFVFWIIGEKYFKRSVFSFLLAIVIFNAMASYQSLFDPIAMSFVQSRFMGMTENPQHAAVLLTSGIPLFLVFIIDTNKRWKKAILVIGLLWTIYYLVLTGSRTGMIMAFVTIMIFLSGYRGTGIKWIVMGSIVVFVFVSITDYNPAGVMDETVLERYGSTENTREDVIRIQMRQFRENILFGANPRGDRVGFAENSYMGVAASLGLLGLLPLFFMIKGIMKLIFSLWRGASSSRNKHFYYLVISGLLSLLIGALAEAYLLGNITWPIILLLCYVHWGYYLLQNEGSLTSET
ncbi:MAG: hypothetical protein ACI849_001584 [Patiriisocius sp.]|jgi:hypothetical protein